MLIKVRHRLFITPFILLEDDLIGCDFVDAVLICTLCPQSYCILKHWALTRLVTLFQYANDDADFDHCENASMYCSFIMRPNFQHFNALRKAIPTGRIELCIHFRQAYRIMWSYVYIYISFCLPILTCMLSCPNESPYALLASSSSNS